MLFQSHTMSLAQANVVSVFFFDRARSKLKKLKSLQYRRKIPYRDSFFLKLKSPQVQGENFYD
eukprot:UN08383